MARRTAATDRDLIAKELAEHTKLDAEHFQRIFTSLDDIGTDVKSLLETRSFTKGIWWTVTTVAGGISLAATLTVAWIKG